MRKARENILVAGGNQSIFAANTPVFVCDADGNYTLNGIFDKQLVIYDYATNISLGPGAVITDADRIVIASGVDTNGDGLADVLRKSFGDSVFGCEIQAATAEPPRCGVESIVDLFYKCVHCHEQFGITVTVEDDNTQNKYPYNRPAAYNFSVDTGCCVCDSCEDGIDAEKLTCLLIDQINNKGYLTNARNQSVFQKLAKKKPNYPFYAVRLYGGHPRASIDYCLDPVAGTCGDCLNMEGVKGLTFTHPVNGATAVTFTNSLNPSDGTVSLQAQLPGIVSQINKALDGFGSAVVTSSLTGTGRPCCPYQLQINTCVTDFALIDDEDAEITPCQEADPFAAIALPNNCPTCDVPGAGSYTPVAGIRIIAKPVDIDCNCDFPPDTPRGYLGRDIKVLPTSGFACGATYVKTVQKQILPENLGYEWKWREYTADNGGSGRGHNPWGYDPHGAFGLPLRPGVGSYNQGSRAYSTKAVCKETYCSYILEHSLPNTDTGIHGRKTATRGRTVILIPSGDAVTRAEFEAIINPYLLSAGCPVKKSIVCSSDQDQIETLLAQNGTVETPVYPNTGGGRIL